MLQPFYVGIDVASEHHVGFREDGQWLKLKNNKTEIKKCLKELPAGSVIGVEATGGYGLLLAEMACKAGFTVFMLVPGRVKNFCKSSPSRGKSDKMDARDITDYIKTFAHRLKPYQPLPEFERKLRTLTRKKEALADKLASVRLQLRSLGDSPKEIEKTLKGLAERIAKLQKEIRAMLETAEDAKVLFTIPCVKDNLAAVLLPALRTIPFKNKYSLDSYAGIDLKPNESGKFKGTRSISHQGDPHIRRAVYLAGFAGTNSKIWKPYYQKLRNEKKLKPVEAINALGRKILHTTYGVYKSQIAFAALPELDMKA